MFYKCVYIIIYIVFVLNRLALGDNSTYKCGICAKENAKLCQIEQSIGYSCFKRSSTETVKDTGKKPGKKKYIHEKAPMTNEARECIPHGIHIDPGFEICCAWSPHTGCNLVLDKQHKGEFCSTCRIQNSLYKDLEICPCSYVSRSGSEQLISIDLKILIGMTIGFYIVQKITNLLN
ncbi:uncharacterized protein LOC110185331 [Drosophila serrata]|uniref:uncharacterized protein LOC110185331 n=1 Tax=Drosophila serrata TaxID=7274 RepID=UPI000A1D29F9|nr:uncharacterized protein LOC110185331 [Drosophila serrata]